MLPNSFSNQNIFIYSFLLLSLSLLSSILCHAEHLKSHNFSHIPSNQTLPQILTNNHFINNNSSNTTIQKTTPTKPQLIVTITHLLQHSRDLNRHILHERQVNERANAQLQYSLKRLSDVSESRADIQKSLRLLNHHLRQYINQSPLYTRTLDVLHRQVGAAILEIERLTTSKSTVVHEKALLQDHFRHRGLEAWVQNYLKDSVNPLVAGAVVEGTADVVEPMLDGIETLAAVNQHLATRMASQLRDTVPIVEKPFYSGFVTYTVLLCPLVLVTSVLLKIKRSLTRFSLGHYVIIANFYFTLLNGGCFVATLLGSVDVLRTFRHTNLGLFDLVMVLHGILYIIHVSLHVVMAFRVKDKVMVTHTLLLITVGAHFFIHSYLHAMHNEDPYVDKKAYAIYTCVFAYVLYKLIVNHIFLPMEAKQMKLNNKSISTLDSEALAAVTVSSPSSASPYLSSNQHKASPSGTVCTVYNNEATSPKETASLGEIRMDASHCLTSSRLRDRGDSEVTTSLGLSSTHAIAQTKADNPKTL